MKLTDEAILRALKEKRIVKRKDWTGSHLTVSIGNKLKIVYLDWCNKQKSMTLSLQELEADDWVVAK